MWRCVVGKESTKNCDICNMFHATDCFQNDFCVFSSNIFRASGSPTPTVKWKRDNMEKIAINKSLVGEYILRSRKSKCSVFGCWTCVWMVTSSIRNRVCRTPPLQRRTSTIINLFLCYFSKHLIATLYAIHLLHCFVGHTKCNGFIQSSIENKNSST